MFGRTRFFGLATDDQLLLTSKQRWRELPTSKANELFAMRHLTVAKRRCGSSSAAPVPGWRGSFSNRPFGGKHFLTDCPPLQCRCRSRARASLRNRHQGPSSIGFEDEAEQSLGRPCRQTDGRSKRTYELTSSIVPRGTSFHRWVELEFPSIGFDPA